MSTDPTDRIARAIEDASENPESLDAEPAPLDVSLDDLAEGDTDEPAGDEGGDGPRVPQALGYDVDRMNEEFALVLMGSKAAILQQQSAGPIEDRVKMLTIDAFKAWLMNRPTEILDRDGKIKRTTWAHVWLVSRKRRQYRGIEFFPDPNAAANTEGYFNLWQGFTVTPRAKKDGYKVFKDHLLTNVCNGSPALYRWVFGWFAHIVQRPREAVSIGAEVALTEAEARYELALGSVRPTGRAPVEPIIPVLRSDDTVATRRGMLDRPVPVASIETFLARQGGLIDAALAERGAEIVAEAAGVVEGAAQAVREDLQPDLDAKQAASSKLAALAADRLLYATGEDTFATAALSAFGRSLLDDADAVSARLTLGLGSAALAAAGDFAAAAHGHGIGGITGLQAALDSKQAGAANLTALAGLALAANKLIYATGAGAVGMADLTAFGRSILDDADAAAARLTLGLGSAAQLTAGTGAGMVPVLDANGKLLSSMLSALAITDVFEVASQAEMLALATAQAGDARLPAERGDIAVRSDLNRCFILKAEPASTLANWVELKTPTDLVISVAGLNGAITAAQLRAALALAIGDVSGLQLALDGKQASSTKLTALAGMTWTANKLLYATGAGTIDTADLTATGRTLLAAADAPAVRTALALGSAALQNTAAFQAALGFNPVQQSGGAGQSANKIYLGYSNAEGILKCQVDATDYGRVWTDFGAGKLLEASGYQKFPSGLVLQWGSVTNAGSDFSTNFPVAFPQGCLGAVASPAALPAGNEAFAVNISNLSQSSIALSCRVAGASGVQTKTNLPIRYLAWGY